MSEHRRPVLIFLAEDHFPDVALIKEALQHAGLNFEIDRAEDGALAIQSLLARDAIGRPDVIIIDLNLPKKTGFDVLAALPRNPVLARVPVVVLTSSNSERDRVRAIELGATAFLSKPQDLQEFLERVGGAVRDVIARKRSAGGWHQGHSHDTAPRPQRKAPRCEPVHLKFAHHQGQS
jgi:two-component system, chemotaxis family, response regulator Rcp1